MWNQIGITADAIFIVVTLGGLELLLFFVSRKHDKDQTEVLEDLTVTLAGLNGGEHEQQTAGDPAKGEDHLPKGSSAGDEGSGRRI